MNIVWSLRNLWKSEFLLNKRPMGHPSNNVVWQKYKGNYLNSIQNDTMASLNFTQKLTLFISKLSQNIYDVLLHTSLFPVQFNRPLFKKIHILHKNCLHIIFYIHCKLCPIHIPKTLKFLSIIDSILTLDSLHIPYWSLRIMICKFYNFYKQAYVLLSI